MDRPSAVKGIDAGLYLHNPSIVNALRRLGKEFEHLHIGVDIQFHIDNSTTTTLVLNRVGACVVTFFSPPAAFKKNNFSLYQRR